jgi:hypothetical protein
MKSKRTFSFIPFIYGIIITSLMMLIFGSSLLISVIKKGNTGIIETITAIIHWYDDPTGFFFAYITGYAILWWKPLLGSILIMMGSLLVTLININNLGFLIFSIPTFLVGFFYIEYWHNKIKGEKQVTIK